jgi:hypothetical protein
VCRTRKRRNTCLEYNALCLRVQKNVSAAPLPHCVALRARDGITTPHHDAILVLAGKQHRVATTSRCRMPCSPGTLLLLSCHSLVEEARDLVLSSPPAHRSRPSVSSDRNHPVVDHRRRDSSSKPQPPLRLPLESANRRTLGRQGGRRQLKWRGVVDDGFWRSIHGQQPHCGNSPVREKEVAVSHFASGVVIIFRVPLGIMEAVPSRG